MNIIKIILYPSPLAPFFGNEEDLKLRCKLEWPYLALHSEYLLEDASKVCMQHHTGYTPFDAAESSPTVFQGHKQCMKT